MSPHVNEDAFTLIELMVVIGIIGILTVMAVPRVTAILQQARYAHAIKDLKAHVTQVHTFRMNHDGELPTSWNEMGFEQSPTDVTRGPYDPWDNRYYYWTSSEKRKCLSSNNTSGNPRMRMMRVEGTFCPINSFFDLFSAGPDRSFHFKINKQESQDDVIVAQDGQFVGKAKNY